MVSAQPLLAPDLKAHCGLESQGGRTTTFHNPVVLQTDSTIAVGAANSIGVIDQPVTGPGSLTKHGDGKLVLSHASNAWAGDTTVLTAPSATGMSVLSLANPTLADGRDVYLSATRTALDLTFAATDTIRSLYFDGIAQATGIWGATGSGAANETALITGTGLLNVTTLPPVGVPGDFNNNGVVDAADYVLWRKGGPLQNEVDDAGRRQRSGLHRLAGPLRQSAGQRQRARMLSSRPRAGDVRLVHAALLRVRRWRLQHADGLDDDR